MVCRCDDRQHRRTERRHRDRVRIVRVILVRPPRPQQPRPRRQRSGDVEHAFARSDQLLGQQIPDATRRLDRPRPLDEHRCPAEQLLDLAARRPHLDRRQLNLGTIDRHRRVRPLMRVDTDHHHHRIVLLDRSGEDRGGHS